MGERIRRTSSRDNSQIDGIFVVMGRTGAGKSFFIETATGQCGKTVGHGLRSYTPGIRPVKVAHPRSPCRAVVFVDTPGFDDTYKSDTVILCDIADWLANIYKQKIKLAGVIYLHRISDNRMPASALDNIRMLSNMCGELAMPNVALVTTMWSEVKGNRGVEREQDLHEEFWRPMLEKGARAMRFDDTPQSAWAIADSILGKDPCPPLAIQIDLVENQKPLGETHANMALRKPPGQLKRLTSKVRRLFSRLR